MSAAGTSEIIAMSWLALIPSFVSIAYLDQGAKRCSQRLASSQLVAACLCKFPLHWMLRAPHFTRKTFQSVLVGLEIVKFLLVYGNFILLGLNLLFKRADLFIIFDAIIQTAVAGNKEQDDEYEDDNPVCINPEEVFM